MRFTIDTNILVYAADRRAGDRRAVALDVLKRSTDRDCILTLQALAELFRTLTGRKLGLSPVAAAAVVLKWRDVMPVVAANETCLTEAMDAVADHGWSFWDAMIWATAKSHGCRFLLTEDEQSGRTLGGVTLVNPFDPASHALLSVALG